MAIQSSIFSSSETLYLPKKAAKVEQEENNFFAKTELLDKNYSIRNSDVETLLGLEDCISLRTKISERFEGHEEYLVEQEFWNDKSVAHLAKVIEKENAQLTPKELSTIRKLCDLLITPAAPKKDPAEKTPVKGVPTPVAVVPQFEIAGFDIYGFFANARCQKAFVHHLLLQKYKHRGASIDLGPAKFKLLLNSFQFICLSRLGLRQTS